MGLRNHGARYAAAMLLMALSAPSALAGAGFETGNDLYTMCNEDDYYSRGVCIGYIMGIVDDFGEEPHTSTCRLPRHITAAQVRDVVVKYLRDHPAERHLSASSEAWVAIFNAWCKQQG